MLRHPRAAARAAVVALCGAAVLLTGCSGAAAPERPVRLADLGAAVGCTPAVSVDADELRQGGCRTAQGRYSMATFTTGRGLRAWLAEAQAYGGTYLVGERWVVTAAPESALAPLRERVGGHLESGTRHPAGHGTAPGGAAAPGHDTGPGHGAAPGHGAEPGHQGMPGMPAVPR
ncbi:hypothetical protein [Streptomyces sp. NPDC089919]|uniref:hypothetical protein n=1 Tax=Streptomyces sp. NPDC089919 TaxID=3155188 RepID=UPI003429ABC1